MDHLETLYETKSLNDEILYEEIHLKLDLLGKKINSFIQAVKDEHQSPR